MTTAKDIRDFLEPWSDDAEVNVHAYDDGEGYLVENIGRIELHINPVYRRKHSLMVSNPPETLELE
jgi:hypothetical protein